MGCHCHDDERECKEEKGHEEERSRKDYIVLVVRIALSLTLALLGKFLFNEEAYPLWVNILFMGSAYIVISYDIFIEAIEGLVKEKRFFDENILMVLSSLGAFALRFFGKDHNEFLEAVLVILLFQVGEIFEDLAADKSKKAILDAIDCQEDFANVSSEGKIIQKKAKDLRVGDIVLINKGEKIVCDGFVRDGNSEVDESSLTGESAPVSKNRGDAVYSGTICSSGNMRIEVSKAYEESTVAKLVKMIEEAEEGKSHTERFITRFAKIYTPVVFILAVAIAIIPPLFLGIASADTWSRWVFVALSFLVVSCPCAIVISVPLAYFSGLGVASKNGILVKAASYFDALNDLKTVAFDKTGTITEGKLTLESVHPLGISEEEFLSHLFILESRSEHPLAKAVMGTRPQEDYEFEEYAEISGKGIKAVYKEKVLLGGRLGFLQESGIEVKEEGVDSTAIYLSIDGNYVGYACFVDNLKKNSEYFVRNLKKEGIRTVLLSGDHYSAVKNQAEKIGVDEFKASLLPEDKLAQIMAKKKEGTLAYLGDGINDAPALVSADIGVAMGGLGSDLAVANADAVLLSDDPAAFLILRRIAKDTKRRAIFNIVFSLLVKVAIMVLEIVASLMGTWSLPLWVCVLGDSGVAVLAILFSLALQLKRYKRP